MNSFANSLRSQLEKATGHTAPWGDVNPLVMIGLTEAILDLGLNEDQMYPVVRGFLRQLAAQVHPDRNPTNFSAARQLQILDALNYLDSRENFSRALNHFRTLKAEDRREVKTLLQTVSALRKQAEEVDRKELSLRTEKESLAAQQAAFRKQQQEEPLKVPELERNIRKLSYTLKRAEAFSRGSRKSQQVWLGRYRRLELYLSNLGYKPFSGPPFHPFAFDAKWVAVAFLSFDDKARLMTPVTRSGSVRKNFREALKKADISMKRLQEIVEAWEDAKARFRKPGKNEKGVLRLTIAVVRLSSGRQELIFGDRLATAGRVIGSLLPKEDANLIRKNLVVRQSHPKILEETLPFLIPGRLLVSVSQDRRKNSPAPLDNIYATSRFFTRRAILAAG